MKNLFKKYRNWYSENALWKKLSEGAKRIGVKTTYTALLLFYAFKRKDTPSWAKSIVIGALGYLISPLDAIPDLSPIIGYTDDIGVLSFALVTVACYIDKEVREKARTRLEKWYGAVPDEVINKVEEKL